MYVDAEHRRSLRRRRASKSPSSRSDEEEELPDRFVGRRQAERRILRRRRWTARTTTSMRRRKNNDRRTSGYEEVPYLLIDHPGVLHATRTVGNPRYLGDFQVTPNGDDAVFTSKVQLTERPTDGNAQVYRYDAPERKISCVSCTPTNAITKSDAFLTPNGNEHRRQGAGVLHLARAADPARHEPQDGCLRMGRATAKGAEPDLDRHRCRQRRARLGRLRAARTRTSSPASRSSPRTTTGRR